MKPSITIETYNKAMTALAVDEKNTKAAIATVTAKIQGLVKPENFDHYGVIAKLAKATKSATLPTNRVAALAAIGVECPEGKLSSTVRDALKVKAVPFLADCDKYAKELAEHKGKLGLLEANLASLNESAKLAESKRDTDLESFFSEVASRISRVFDVEKPCGRFTAEINGFAIDCEDKEDLSKLESSLIELSICDSSINPDCSKSYLSGLDLPYLSEFISGLGSPVASPVETPDVSAGYDDGTPKPPVLAPKKKWQEFARGYSGTLVNRDTIADKAFSRLMALGKRVVLHAQRGTLSSIRAAEKSGIVSSRTDQIVLGTIDQIHKVLQGGINLGVKLAVETNGKDLSILNRVTNCPLIWTKGTGFSLADFRTYIEDCLPHLEFKKGQWQLRSKKALENRKLGSFGIYIFGQLPARLVTEKPPVFPMLDWLQFRGLKKQFSREASAANKAAKAEFENAWAEFEESFPLEQQLETLESTLSKLDAERQAIVEKAAKLKAAMQ